MFCCLTTYFQSWAKHKIRATVPRETLGVLRRICFGSVVRERGVREGETYFGFVQVGRVFSRAIFSCVSSGGMRATPFKVSTGFLGQVVL